MNDPVKDEIFDTMGVKVLRVSKLKSLLASVDDDLLCSVNKVGNLSIYNKDMGFVCFVDFMDGSIEFPPPGSDNGGSSSESHS